MRVVWQLLWVTALLALHAGCSSKRSSSAQKTPAKAGVPNPLDNPAGYCRESCPRKVQCKLGRISAAAFAREVKACRESCLAWIKTHAREAEALFPCYQKGGCGQFRGCLAEVSRIVQDITVPAKVRECAEMCYTLGTCQGDEKDCTLRCKTRDIPMYRALIRCGTKKCPEIRTCVTNVLADK